MAGSTRAPALCGAAPMLLLLPLLLLAGWPAAAKPIPVSQRSAARCTSKKGENCNETMCCNIPGHKCFQKNKGWAVCLKTCKPGPHWNEPPYKGDPWSCVELTGGCSPMYGQCGTTEGYAGPPCCEWGCMCNRTDPEGGYWQCIGTNHSSAFVCQRPASEVQEKAALARGPPPAAAAAALGPRAIVLAGLVSAMGASAALAQRARSRGLLRWLHLPLARAAEEDAERGPARAPQLSQAEE